MNTTNNKGAPRNGTPSTPRTYSNKSRWNYKGGFDRARLPNPSEYYAQQGLKMTGGGEWKNAICPFHPDTKPSLRVTALENKHHGNN